MGHQVSFFREEARVIIARTINARDDKDALIFTGSGSTAAVNHLVRAMRLTVGAQVVAAENRPVVFVGPHEHHSNVLPWRESICEVVNVPENPSTGAIDVAVLEEQLKTYAKRPLLIGTFSAASNITGILQDCPTINKVLHQHNALAFWDVAAAAPYVKIDMNPMASNEEDRGLVHCDALFISPHKFPGGICTPGLLVAKKHLFDRTLPPCTPGGGTVDFVTDRDQLYLSKIHEREEAGTPDIIGCIRAGLVFQLKHAVTPELIERLEADLFTKAVNKLQKNPRIHLMGPLTKPSSSSPGQYERVPRLPTLSFVIYHQSGKLLHYNFVCALLDNLFGIQSRGGCVCAGPYGQYLLGMDIELSKLYEEQLNKYDDVEVLRPGFVRLSLNYFISPEEADYVLDAVDFVAREGWKLLPEYSFQPETNEWMHLSNKSLPNRKWLGEVSYSSGKMTYPKQTFAVKRTTKDLPQQFADAKRTVEHAEQQIALDHREADFAQEHELLRENAEELRWFVYPDEAYLKRIDIEDEDLASPGTKQNYHNAQWRQRWLDTCPFSPRYYPFNADAFAASSSLSTSIMPKTHRFTATVTDLESALSAKSDQTAKAFVSPSSTPTPVPISESTENKHVHVESPAESPTANLQFVVPVTKPSAATIADSDEHEEAMAEAIYEQEGEELSSHKHEADEEKDADDELDMCCPLPRPGQAASSACGVPAATPGRSSVKTMIDQRKAEKKAKFTPPEGPEDTSTRDKRQSNEARELRKVKRLERFDPVQQIEHRIFKQMVAAIRLFDLIGPGDKVLVGVSGGKDSLTLLNMLLKAQKFLPFKFEVGAVTVDPQTLEFDPSPLKLYMAELGVKYFYDSQPLISIAGDIGPSSICAWCSRMKRGILHNICEREGYNVLALGQHLDDLVESFFMYAFHNGKLDTMKSASVVREGRLKIVRPFVFVREKDTKHYANLSNLPVITENCPACFEEPKERARIKALLKAQERLYPNLFGNLLGAIKPLMHPDLHLDELLTKLDTDSKTQKNKKYYPKRRTEEEQKAYREAKAKAKAEKAANNGKKVAASPSKPESS